MANALLENDRVCIYQIHRHIRFRYWMVIGPTIGHVGKPVVISTPRFYFSPALNVKPSDICDIQLRRDHVSLEPSRVFSVALPVSSPLASKSRSFSCWALMKASLKELASAIC